MKKLFFFFALLLASVTLVFSQVGPPSDIIDAISNIDLFMGSLLGLGFLSVWVTGTIIGFLGGISSALKQIISWLIPVTISVVIGNLLNVGFLAEEPIAIGVLYGFGAGLVSNGIFEIGFVNTAIKWIQDKIG